MKNRLHIIIIIIIENDNMDNAKMLMMYGIPMSRDVGGGAAAAARRACSTRARPARRPRA